MDPFQQPSHPAHAFRAVPMTHLVSLPSNPSAQPQQQQQRAPFTISNSPRLPAMSAASSLPATSVLGWSNASLTGKGDPFTSANVECGSVSNMRKWKDFGLKVAAPETLFDSASMTVSQTKERDAPRQYARATSTHFLEPPLPPRHSIFNADSVEENSMLSFHRLSGSHPIPPRNAASAASSTRKEMVVVVEDEDGAVEAPKTPPPAQRTTSAAAEDVPSPPPRPQQPRHLFHERAFLAAPVASARCPSTPSPGVPPAAPPMQPPQQQQQATSASVTPAATLHHSNESDVAVAPARRLQLELAQLSEKVQQSAEEQRCGPPSRNGDAGGNTPSWASKRWGGKNSAKRSKGAREADDGDARGVGDGDEGVAEGEESSAEGGASITKPARKRGRATATAVNTDESTAPATKKATKRKPRSAAEDGDGKSGRGGKGRRAKAAAPTTDSVPGTVNGAASHPASASRTLFSISGGGTSVMATLPGVAAPAATVTVPFFYLQSNTDDLFNDLRRTLHDPDRIQAPPLFVGLSTLASGTHANAAAALPLVECRTNFSFSGNASKAAKGRASKCFSDIDPFHSNQHVELIFVRWKDAMYALPAQTTGFALLCRVLTELPGVELITFNAQVLLVALLAYCKGTLWSQCISDVRVMAWMAQLHIVGAGSSSNGGGGGGGAAAARVSAAEGISGDADMNVLYDYEQLLVRVSGGKVPPFVQLEKALESDSYNNNSGNVFAPPLTPAQRRLAQQVYYLATVYRSLYGLLGSKGLLQAFLRQEKRIALLLALMRFNGIGVDLPEVHRYQKSCEAEMTRQRTQASKCVPELGEDFNIQSPDQCRRAIYEILQLGRFLVTKPPGDGDTTGGSTAGDGLAGSGLTITKGGRLSTAEDTLRALAPHHEFPACLLRYRKASKLMQTYVEGMMSFAIVRTAKTGGGGTSTTAAAGTPEKSNSTAPVAPPPPLGETAEVNDTNPFVDRLLDLAGTHENSATCSSAAAPTTASGDEDASVTAVGDLTLPSRGFATIHPNFLQEGTDTGRLSCVEPNLQNLPRNGSISMPANKATTNVATGNKTVAGDAAEDAEAAAEAEDEEGDLLGFRRCFVAPPSYVLLSVDYQQIELRVLAHLCGDMALLNALTQSADIHRAIAEVVFKKRPVSSEERSLAKRVVFGVLYGAGPKTLAAHMGVSVERALHITSLLTNAFPGIESYHRRVIEESRVNGFVRTISGRLRYLPDIQSTVMSRRSYAERQAFNSVVQGSAADIMKMAMLAVAKEVLQCYDRAEVRLLSQIHDEMVFMVRKELMPSVVPLVSSAMSHAMHLLVPLSVTVKWGHSLGDLREWLVEHDLGLDTDF